MLKNTKHRSNELHAPISGVIPAAVIAAGLSGPVAWSAPGDLDPTFGDLGFAELPQDLSGAIWALEAIDDKVQAAGVDEYCDYYYGYYHGTAFRAACMVRRIAPHSCDSIGSARSSVAPMRRLMLASGSRSSVRSLPSFRSCQVSPCSGSITTR